MIISGVLPCLYDADDDAATLVPAAAATSTVA